MNRIVFVALILLCCETCSGSQATKSNTQHQTPILATVSEIKSHPSVYDGKIVKVSGWLQSGHLGVSLYSEDRTDDAVHLRSPDEISSDASLKVQRDRLFEQFWQTVEVEIRKPSPVYVEIEGLVRMLKKDGKPADSFYIFGQWPTELVPLRILKIERR